MGSSLLNQPFLGTPIYGNPHKRDIGIREIRSFESFQDAGPLLAIIAGAKGMDLAQQLAELEGRDDSTGGFIWNLFMFFLQSEIIHLGNES